VAAFQAAIFLFFWQAGIGHIASSDGSAGAGFCSIGCLVVLVAIFFAVTFLPSDPVLLLGACT